MRLRVADGLYMLFESNELTGWMLDSPVRYLSDGSREYIEPADDPELAKSLASYLSLAGYPSLDSLLDGDPAVRISLEEIQINISADRGDLRRRAILREKIADLISSWY
jgi:hypothetical protein